MKFLKTKVIRQNVGDKTLRFSIESNWKSGWDKLSNTKRKKQGKKSNCEKHSSDQRLPVSSKNVLRESGVGVKQIFSMVW
jgi:hypothetical protein